ncbi:MAG: sugar ABC transporter ATP-binding protein [Planctomycetaceae bacterium]|nr:sugar ABC transporter ATP-binding protein [Planctomycetaceae bacterium]
MIDNSRASQAPLLKMEGITKRFGPTVALEDVSFSILPGRVTALIGENGAGKSTLMRVLSGAILPDTGTVQLAGESYAPQHPHDARLSGISMIYQELTIAQDLSIEDNILLGCESSRFGFLKLAEQHERIKSVLELIGLDHLSRKTPARDLSPAQQQLVEIARALVVESRVVIFDEPTSSLTAQDAQRLFQIIQALKDRGLGIIYISHFLEEVRELCDDYIVLRDGHSVGSGPLEKTDDESIIRLMIGREVNDLFPTVPHQAGDILLETTKLTGRPSPTKVSLELRRGEILGLAGLIGSGRTELLRCLYGLDAIRSGDIKLATVSIHPSPKASIQAGLGFVSEDRKTEGLAQGMSIEDNLTLSGLQPYSKWGFLNLQSRSQSALQWMDRLQVKANSSTQPISDLSGGNQQKVAIARVMHQEADILLLDEPTRGIDVGTKAEIYRLIGELAASGKAILFVSSYLPELMAICDRIGVMSQTQLVEVRDTSQWTEDEVMQVATRKIVS